MRKIPIILTMAGSDSGGGAGIEADIKTIASLGLHTTCAITSVTSQNTTGVLSTYDIPCEVISNQIDAVCEDMDIIWAKSGMLASSDIISTVAEMVEKYDLKLIVDPVMAAEAGGDLLQKDAITTLKQKLLPISEVVTPNINEANLLSGMQITNIEEAKKAAKLISQTGVKIVIVTGGHLDASDIIYNSETDSYTIIPGTFVKGGTHGSGCTYSAALASSLAQGYKIEEAAKKAKNFVVEAIKASVPVGKGVGPVNQLSYVLKNSQRYTVLQDLKNGVDALIQSKHFVKLIPEVGCNIAMALPSAASNSEVAAITGRIVKLKGSSEVVGEIEFGASSHVAPTILTAMKHNSRSRACMNIRYSQKLVDICRRLDLSVASFAMDDEPADTHTMDRGTSQAINKYGAVPDIIYNKGAIGKEAMIRIMGQTATEIANKAVKIAEIYACQEE